MNTFVFDEDLNHISVLTTGTHDRAYMKRSAKNFPKKLLNLPWKIDYRLRVPVNTDLEVNAGHGAVKLSGVEGALRVSATESDTALTLTGGTVSTTVTAGSITLDYSGAELAWQRRRHSHRFGNDQCRSAAGIQWRHRCGSPAHRQRSSTLTKASPHARNPASRNAPSAHAPVRAARISSSQLVMER